MSLENENEEENRGKMAESIVVVTKGGGGGEKYCSRGAYIYVISLREILIREEREGSEGRRVRVVREGRG